MENLRGAVELEGLQSKGWNNCLTPSLKVTDKGTRSFGACGKCSNCLKRRRAQWIGRLLLEHAWTEQQYGKGSSIFLTLTYNEENLGPMKLEKSDLQKFFKRFRMNTQKSVRYFAAGEYGSKNGRKHWHLLMWGPHLTSEIVKLEPGAYTTDGKPKFRTLNLEEQLTECWQKGFVQSRPVIPQRVAYAAKYALKTATEHEPMILFSNKPGLGQMYLKHMMEKLAKAKPQLKKLPSTFQIGKYHYSLSSSSFQRCRQYYQDAGGQISHTYSETLMTIASDFQIGWRGEIQRRLGIG